MGNKVWLLATQFTPWFGGGERLDSKTEEQVKEKVSGTAFPGGFRFHHNTLYQVTFSFLAFTAEVGGGRRNDPKAVPSDQVLSKHLIPLEMWLFLHQLGTNDSHR